MPTHTATSAEKFSDMYIKPVFGLAFFYLKLRCWAYHATIASLNDALIGGLVGTPEASYGKRRKTMMILATRPEVVDQSTVFVHWKVGQNRGGCVRVTIPSETENSPLVAELCTIRHLLLRKQVFNVLPMTGKGIALYVSTGAIRKLLLGTSNKKDAQAYARFLKPRLDGIDIKVVHEPIDNFPHSQDDLNHCEISATEPYFETPYDPIEGPAIGQVIITAHAVEQYIKRSGAELIKNPWASLMHRLMHEDLKKLPLPDNVIRHKERKYGKDNVVEAWGHENSLFGYLVITDETGKRMLVTVYRREPMLN